MFISVLKNMCFFFLYLFKREQKTPRVRDLRKQYFSFTFILSEELHQRSSLALDTWINTYWADMTLSYKKSQG